MSSYGSSAKAVMSVNVAACSGRSDPSRVVSQACSLNLFDIAGGSFIHLADTFTKKNLSYDYDGAKYPSDVYPAFPMSKTVTHIILGVALRFR